MTFVVPALCNIHPFANIYLTFDNYYATATISKRNKKNPHTGDTDSLDVCGYYHCVKKLNKIFGSDLKHLLVFKALSKSNPEQLLVFRAHSGDDPRVKHLPRVDNPQVQFGTNPCFKGSTSPIRNNSSFLLRLHAGTIHESNTSHKSNLEQLLVFKTPQVGSTSWVNELGEQVGCAIQVHESGPQGFGGG